MTALDGLAHDPERPDPWTVTVLDEEPKTKDWDSQPETDKWLASHHFGEATPKVPFRIEGWLARQGTAVWFGAGSTGKTQLLLWMAAMIASRPENRAPTWLGGKINGTGHVLILTAEDARTQIVGRLRDIAQNTMHQSDELARDTCSRLHVMPFISMTEDEFKHPNASLLRFAEDRVWRASEVMKEVRHYITAWNARHDDPEDRIVGVVMDSATSMAGFDSMEGDATTNFFFYLGRLCETLGIFFTIIGHVPKAAFVPQKDPWGTAAARLRGVAMWTTAPRMAVEVRVLQEWGKKSGIEQSDLREKYPDLKRQDFLAIYAAKANLLDVCREPRFVIRNAMGAFEEVEVPAPAPANSAQTGSDPQVRDTKPLPGKARAKPKKGSVKASGKGDRPKDEDGKPAAYYARGTDLVIRAMHVAYPNIAEGQLIFATRIVKTIKAMEDQETLAVRHLVTGASGGGVKEARPGSIAWHFKELADRGILVKGNGGQSKARHRLVRVPPR